jgi:hypothetical protein
MAPGTFAPPGWKFDHPPPPTMMGGSLPPALTLVLAFMRCSPSREGCVSDFAGDYIPRLQSCQSFSLKPALRLSSRIGKAWIRAELKPGRKGLVWRLRLRTAGRIEPTPVPGLHSGFHFHAGDPSSKEFRDNRKQLLLRLAIRIDADSAGFHLSFHSHGLLLFRNVFRQSLRTNQKLVPVAAVTAVAAERATRRSFASLHSGLHFHR